MLTKYTTSYSVPALSAGASGYWTIPVDVTGQIVSVLALCSLIAKTGGLQITPIYITDSYLYINYYAPSAITAGQVTLNIHVVYDDR